MIPQTLIDDENKTSNNIVFFDGEVWRGHGTMIILQTGAVIHFDMTKTLQEKKEGVIIMTQQVNLKEINERWSTQFKFHQFENEQFDVELHNDTVGHIHGDGYYNDSDVSWKIYDEQHSIIGKTQFMHLQHDAYLINSTYKFPGTTQISISGVIQLCT
ncbi:MAG: hypothetical protein AAGG81_09155 [Chlamydiota bacterium]